MTSKMTQRGWRWFCLVLLALGFAASGYLLSRSFTLIGADASTSQDLCSIVFGSSCDEALKSGTAWLLGIPIAGWGIVYYSTLICLLAMAWLLGESFQREANLGLLVLALIGACASVFWSWVLLGGSIPLCLLCLVVHSINFALVPVCKFNTGQSTAELLFALRKAGYWLVRRQENATELAAWKAVGFLCAALVGLAAYQWVLVECSVRVAATQLGENSVQIVTAYVAEPRNEIPADEDDLRLGPRNAPLQLVVFSSFQCPGCRQFAQQIDYLANYFGSSLSIVFKHYPLSTQCNERMKVDKHPRSCAGALAAEAAHRQGKFWPFHDAVFAEKIDFSEETLRKIAGETGLDLKRFDEDRLSSAVLGKVKADIELGNRLEVHATPSVFLNGRRVRRHSSGVLDVLIHHLLDAQENHSVTGQ